MGVKVKKILPCMKCLQEKGKPNFNMELQEFKDNGVYVYKCSQGHESYIVDQVFKFERLFDIAGFAYLDGYYREAVASSTSALERFYEFSIKVFLKEFLKSEKPIEFEKTWKQVANQSERQLGAYCFLYLLKYKESPIVIDNKKVSFRNSVIHKGKIPTKEEAYEYMDYIYKYIQNELKKMKENFNEDIQNVVFDELILKRKEAKIPENENITTSVDSVLISLAKKNESELKEELNHLKEYKEKVLGGIQEINNFYEVGRQNYEKVIS